MRSDVNEEDTSSSHINVKPAANIQTTRISKRAIYAGVAILGLAGLGGFEYMQHHPMFGTSSHSIHHLMIGSMPDPRLRPAPSLPPPPSPRASTQKIPSDWSIHWNWSIRFEHNGKQEGTTK